MSYLPDIDDFFPKTRRGHGFGTRGGQCGASSCDTHPPRYRGEHHRDKAANIKDWEATTGADYDLMLARQRNRIVDIVAA